MIAAKVTEKGRATMRMATDGKRSPRFLPAENKKANPEIGLIACLDGAPGAIRTPDSLVRS